MTLDRLRPHVSAALDPFVAAADRLGLTPNGVSVLAFLLAAGAGGAFYVGRFEPVGFLVGAFCVAANGWLDVVDGELARKQEVASPAGDLLDHVLDRYADVLMLAGLAAASGRYGLGFAAVTGVLMTSYLGTQAQAVGLDRVYGGLVGRADRLVIIGVVGGAAFFVPGPVALGLTLIGWLLAFFAVIGHFTALQRFYSAWTGLD